MHHRDHEDGRSGNGGSPRDAVVDALEAATDSALVASHPRSRRRSSTANVSAAVASTTVSVTVANTTTDDRDKGHSTMVSGDNARVAALPPPTSGPSKLSSPTRPAPTSFSGLLVAITQGRPSVPLLLLALVGLVVVVEMLVDSQLLARCLPHGTNAHGRGDRSPIHDHFQRVPRDGCSPATVDPLDVPYRSEHRFYDLLKRLGPLPSPVFTGKFQVLCAPQEPVANADAPPGGAVATINEDNSGGGGGLCLPIGGLTDPSFCRRADRMDLLARHPPGTVCRASVLHMLFADVYNELQGLRAGPLVLHRTLREAMRNRSLVEHADVADVAHTRLSPSRVELLQSRLWAKGYAMHRSHHREPRWRVCVAPTHPLAADLFTPDAALLDVGAGGLVPHVMLYGLWPLNERQWRLEGTEGQRLLADDRVVPHSTIEINGLAWDTLADPVHFLVEEYGAEWATTTTS